MLFRSTRNKADVRTPSAAIVQGMSEDGGLYVPETIPVFDKSMRALSALNYRELAYEVMKLYLTDFTEEELRQCIEQAYAQGFDTPEPVALVAVGGRQFLELYHGRTIAFKDMALSILPHLMVTAAKKNEVQDELVVVTATSGDTGKAAMAGFANVKNTRIIVFYPKDGVSPVQERQMVTQEGDNVSVVAIRGNFDDAQTAVKKMMEDEALRHRLSAKGYRFSSANSINIGRLVPQIVYYVYAYTRLLADGTIADGECINITVPTGNFGNILAAHYARRMGLPVHKLICASNENKVLYDFFQSGAYDRNRPFHVTTSPSMDILISSNLERLIDELTGGDTQQTGAYMHALATNGHYELNADMRSKLDGFAGGFADVKQTAERIRTVYKTEHYLMDPHTAVADAVYAEYQKTSGDHSVTVIASTASPYKFPKTVIEALDGKAGDDFDLFESIQSARGGTIPEAVRDLASRPVLHDTVIDTASIADTVAKILGLCE